MKAVGLDRPEGISEEEWERLVELECEKAGDWLFERTFGIPKAEFEKGLLEQIKARLGSSCP